MRAAHAEKLRAKRLLRELAKSVHVARSVMDPGDEVLVFMPDGKMAHMRLEDEVRFRVHELESIDDAVDVQLGWNRAERAGESIQ